MYALNRKVLMGIIYDAKWFIAIEYLCNQDFQARIFFKEKKNFLQRKY